ncbi:glutathione S-transferase N-terminal domain-containing protein [Chitinolyticbacter meiyuanensis]|uniref:glutathione S-transferase N-terminal domain-containing protein n=1 Tax=Chitinolyticbacter meiyuanensis TaxID=682798 RepID=UPI0011E5D2DF|nr:glutathione S-transferase C-terminal domain-containing protein [Chitinolyticbacter meiyuanensis]
MPHQLYIANGACSLGAHVVVRELGLPVEIVKVKTRVADSPIHAVNPLGRVPALKLEDGTVITENSAILPFLADLAPGTPLFAPAGSAERGLIQSWIGYFSAEVHAGGFRAVNRPERYSNDEAAFDGIRTQSRATLKQTVAHIDRHLAGKEWLVGNRFTIADAYLGVFVRWIARFGTDFADLEHLNTFRERYNARASVQAALVFEQQE